MDKIQQEIDKMTRGGLELAKQHAPALIRLAAYDDDIVYSVGFNTSTLWVDFMIMFFYFCIRLACEPCKVERNTPTLCVGDSLT